MKFEKDCPLKKLKPFQQNPRKNDMAVDAVAKSLERFGAVAPIIVNQDYEICAGHTRYKAAMQIGRETFPVVVVDLKGDEFIGYNIADNKTGEIAEWDDKGLAVLIQGLNWNDFDMDSLGFDGNELKEIMGQLNFSPGSLDDQGRLDEITPTICPKCGHSF